MTTPEKRPAIFLDRDGTLSHEVGYVNHPSRFRLYPWSVDAIRAINKAGWLAVLVTNQAGVARGYFPETVVHQVLGKLREEMAAGGARFDGIYACLHHPSVGEPPYRKECDCRKPKPGMLHRAEREIGADLSRSWMVGDRHGDLQVAWNVGARGAPGQHRVRPGRARAPVPGLGASAGSRRRQRPRGGGEILGEQG